MKAQSPSAYIVVEFYQSVEDSFLVLFLNSNAGVLHIYSQMIAWKSLISQADFSAFGEFHCIVHQV